jgi:hypothetical protein
MANTDITLIHSDGNYVPSAASVSVVNGDTVSFSTNDGSSALAYFSPDTLAVLSPKPANPATIGSAGKTVFSFSSSSPGAYSVFFAADAASAPANYPSRKSQALLLETAASEQPPFDNRMNVGH